VFLLSIALLTLGIKVTYYTQHMREVFESRQQSDLDAFLLLNGWSRTGNQRLDMMGIISAGRYVGGNCSGEMRILIMDPAGDTAGVVGGLVEEGDQLFFHRRRGSIPSST
jgi:hypothetical protein